MNSFGTIFRVSIFGESHGCNIGVVIDGCPPGISLTEDDFQHDLMRRKSGSVGTTPRMEGDVPNVVSGVYNGHTTGAPITVIFENKNTQSKDYSQFKKIPRPGHADFTAMKKYEGHNDERGGGHFSGRITLGIVAAGVIAKKIIAPSEITAKLVEAGGSPDIEKNVMAAVNEGDSVGGIVECVGKNFPIGLGEPFFNSAESLISHIVFSIPAVKGIEFGSGFSAARMKGSEHNDNLIDRDGKTSMNNSGGINGGITNGNDIFFRVAFKPTPSIKKTQNTFDFSKGEITDLSIEGRHDACLALRTPPIVECAAAIVLADLMLISGKYKN